MKGTDKDLPQGKLTRVKDFLPSPDKLILPSEVIKVTISLKRSSVDFFKQQAQKHKTKYQKMIRELLDRYAGHYSVR